MKNKEFKLLIESWQNFLNESESAYEELHLYDFDDTLFRSPFPPDWWYEDISVYKLWDPKNPPTLAKNITEEWDTSTESLGPPFMPLNPPLNNKYWKTDVVKNAIDSQNNVRVYNVFCTGRNIILKNHIEDMMSNVGLNFDKDKMFLRKDDSPSVVQFKVNVVKDILDKNLSIKKVQVWEDSSTNLNEIERLCKEYNIEFVGHKIPRDPIVIEMTKEEYLKIKN